MVHNAAVASAGEFLCALLLITIQDDSFNTVHNTILKELDHTIHQLLGDIHDRDTALQIKDSAHVTGGNGINGHIS